MLYRRGLNHFVTKTYGIINIIMRFYQNTHIPLLITQ